MLMVPTSLLILKERAESFQRCVELLHQRWQQHSPELAFDQDRALVFDLLEWDALRPTVDMPRLVLEKALQWANSPSPPPVAALREARATLESTARIWAISWGKLHALLLAAPDDGRWAERLQHVTQFATSQQRRIKDWLQERWPVGPELEETQRLQDMKAGGSLSLDEAFALAAGVDAQGWEEKVRAHRRSQQA